jgi:hypothetical protein
MKFYEIDSALQEAVIAADKPVRLKIEIQITGHFESVFEQDIIEANFYGLKEAAGGTSSRGEILIANNNYQLTMELVVRCVFPSQSEADCRIFSGSGFTLTIKEFKMSGGRGGSGMLLSLYVICLINCEKQTRLGTGLHLLCSPIQLSAIKHSRKNR